MKLKKGFSLKKGLRFVKTTPKVQQGHKDFGVSRVPGQPEEPLIGRFSDPHVYYRSFGTPLIIPSPSLVRVSAVISSFNDLTLAADRLGLSPSGENIIVGILQITKNKSSDLWRGNLRLQKRTGTSMSQLPNQCYSWEGMMMWQSWTKRTFLSNWKVWEITSGGSEKKEEEVNVKDMVNVLFLFIDCITSH